MKILKKGIIEDIEKIIVLCVKKSFCNKIKKQLYKDDVRRRIKRIFYFFIKKIKNCKKYIKKFQISIKKILLKK